MDGPMFRVSRVRAGPQVLPTASVACCEGMPHRSEKPPHRNTTMFKARHCKAPAYGAGPQRPAEDAHSIIMRARTEEVKEVSGACVQR
jgi:hypothetical protein